MCIKSLYVLNPSPCTKLSINKKKTKELKNEPAGQAADADPPPMKLHQ